MSKMNQDVKEKYLDSFRRVYFDGDYEIDAGKNILSRKAKVLKLDDQNCKSLEKQSLEKYEEFKGLLKDIDISKELTENQKKEIKEFQGDLELTDYEVEELEKIVLKELDSHLSLKDENDKVKDFLVKTKEKNSEEFEEKSISNTNLVIKIPSITIHDKFFYGYKALADKSKENFFIEYFNLDHISSYTASNIGKIFYKTFSPFLDVIHKYLVDELNFITYRKEDLFKFFNLSKLEEITDNFQEVAERINLAVEYDKMERKSARGSSSTFAYGSLGFMALVGAVNAAGNAAGSISDSWANSNYASKLNKQGLNLCRETASDIEDILNIGILQLYDAVYPIASGIGRSSLDILNAQKDASSIMDNSKHLKDKDDTKYINRLLQIIYTNPYYSYAYFELCNSLSNDNFSGKLDVLEFGLKFELFKDIKEKYNEQISLLNYELDIIDIKNKNLSPNDLIAEIKNTQKKYTLLSEFIYNIEKKYFEYSITEKLAKEEAKKKEEEKARKKEEEAKKKEEEAKKKEEEKARKKEEEAKKKQEKILKSFISKSVNDKDKYGNTPLHDASDNGYKEVVEFLISKGADVNAKSNNGGTPLLRASQNGHKEVVEFLISKGADVNAKSDTGNTPLILSSDHGHKEIVEFLISKGADVNAKSDTGNTPLHCASYGGHKEVVEFLISKGADVNNKTNDKSTSLHKASKNGHKEVVEFLISKGADVNAKNNDGNTPLHDASDNGHKEVVEFLISKGADTSARKSNCFITSATCLSLQKSDDCYELNTFRDFRDYYLIYQTDGKELIEEYYRIAPDIVKNINNHSNKRDLYDCIWQEYLSKCLNLIEQDKYDEAKSVYINMVKTLQAVLLPAF